MSASDTRDEVDVEWDAAGQCLAKASPELRALMLAVICELTHRGRVESEMIPAVSSGR